MERSPDQSLSSPLAVVTGASSGIGLELAKQFGQHGFDLIIIAEDEGIVTAAESLRSTGAQVEAVQADLAARDGVEAAWNRIKASGRPVEAAAINAGVGVGGPFIETDLDAEINLINLNCTSTVHLAKRLLPEMAARRSGRVLFTSSVAADMPGPYESVYAASKAFVLSFAEALRYELRDTGVTITALQPGPTETNFFHRAGMDDTKVGRDEKDDPADVAREGFDALMHGKDHVVAGSVKNKLEVAVGQIMPETAKAARHGKLAEPQREADT